jgi:hypothetical protein
MNKKSSPIGRPRSASSSSRAKDYDPYLERKKAYLVKMKQREKMLYNDAVECPICFLVSVKVELACYVACNNNDNNDNDNSITPPIPITLAAVINPFAPNVLCKSTDLLKHPWSQPLVLSACRKTMVLCMNHLHGVRNSR